MQLLERMVERTAVLKVDAKADRTKAAVLVGLTRVAASLANSTRQNDTRKEIERVVEVVGEFQATTENRRAYVSEMLADLERMRESTRVKRRRGRVGLVYLIKLGPTGEELYERRKSGRETFHVSRRDYDVAIDALAEAFGKPMKFDLLERRFSEKGGGDVASDYPLRVILRFWRATKPPLVSKQRAHYAPTAETADDFRRYALEAWERLSRENEGEPTRRVAESTRTPAG